MVKNSFKICLQCDETKPKIDYTYHQSHQLITRSNFIGFMDAPNLTIVALKECSNHCIYRL